jgi:hypothetical protein
MTEVWAYIARLNADNATYVAGTVVGAISDDPKFAKDTAKEVARWIAKGCAVERVPSEWVRKHLFTTQPYVPEIAA